MTKLTRRTLVFSAAAASVAPGLAWAAPQSLRAEPATLQILPKGENATALWGFNGKSPGPELRFRQGDRAAIRFENATDQPSSVHWHGIRLKNAMDGVPGLTQPLVQPGDGYDYTFNLPDAGTFSPWFRPWVPDAFGKISICLQV